MTNQSGKTLGRRDLLMSALAVTATNVGLPLLGRGSFQAFAAAPTKYSARAMKLVERSLVIEEKVAPGSDAVLESRNELANILIESTSDYQKAIALHAQNLVDRGENMRLGPPERGKPQRCQPHLKWAKIATTQGQIMKQVPRAFPVVRVNLGKARLRLGQACNHVRPNEHELTQNTLDVHAFLARAVGAVFPCYCHLQAPSISASVPCFNSPAGMASEWM